MTSPREGDDPSHLANEQHVADVAAAGEEGGRGAEASAAADVDSRGKSAEKGKGGGARGKGTVGGEGDAGGARGGDAHSAAECEELPRTVVRRIVKAKVQALMEEGGAAGAGGRGGAAGGGGEGGGRKKEVQVAKEALVALGEGARVFIHYLTATANDLCRSSKRQTVSAADVLSAIDDIGFSEFLPALQSTLEAVRNEKTVKRKGMLERREAAAAAGAGVTAGDAAWNTAGDAIGEAARGPAGGEAGTSAAKGPARKRKAAHAAGEKTGGEEERQNGMF